ncbi:DUF3800 domain-containing protein [Candidatus Parcubacteria bacterium]|nr:DUF3800 domain-containing protein [Candidatus Parcubacteria bacterium]
METEQNIQEKTKYNIYLDESSIDNPGNKYMIIGGVFVARNRAREVIGQIKEIKKRHNFLGEIKWVKTDNKKEKFLKEVVDYVITQVPETISYHGIVVNKEDVDYEKYHDGDKELAFFKFMYELLEKRLKNNKEYYVFLDFKPTSKERVRKLNDFLNSFIYFNKDNCSIKHLQAYDSKENILIQVADLFCGAVGYHHNNFPVNTAKDRICNHIAGKLGKSNLRFCSPPYEKKFNIFCISLS